MTVNRNLEPGQFQIGDLVMGPRTPFSIEDMDIGNYDINAQDYQNAMSNENRFGQDTLKPAPVILTINVKVNRLLDNIGSLTKSVVPLDFSHDENISDLQREWRAEETLMNWGEMKPLLFCGTDGISRQYYGRPGKFSYKKHKIVNSLYYVATAEFRRADTFAYGSAEYAVIVNPLESKTITRQFGNAKSWVRFYIIGPANHPIINWGTKQIELNWNIPSGVAVEISSYPWERRVVDSNGLSLAAYIVTDRPYLDTIMFPYKTPMLTSFNASGTNATSKLVVVWQDAYQVMD